VVNPTAGLFSGDKMGLSVELDRGARVAMSSPSASRFYDTAGGEAKITQKFKVGPEAWLEYHSNWLIPQQGSSVEQSTVIEVEEGGALMFCDRLAPGRVKSGEQYRYRRYCANFELSYGGQICATERMELEAEQGGWPLVVPGWEVCFYGAVWLVGASISKHCDKFQELSSQVGSESLLCGATALSDHVIVVRLVAARSLLLKKAMSEVRNASKTLFPIINRELRLLQSL